MPFSGSALRGGGRRFIASGGASCRTIRQGEGDGWPARIDDMLNHLQSAGSRGMDFAIARPSCDGKARRACTRGCFTPHVTKGNCPFRYTGGPRLGQLHMRPTLRPPLPLLRHARNRVFFNTVGGILRCGNSFRGTKALKAHPPCVRARARG